MLVVFLVVAAAVGVHVEPAVAGTIADWKQVDTGFGHTCAVTTGGRLFCWGLDSEGQLGDGVIGPNSPVPFELGGTDWAQVTTGARYTCALKTDRRIFCWGADNFGQLGDGTIGPNTPVPQQVGADNDWKQVSAGGEFTCATKKGGRLYCWGRDEEGQLGDGVTGPNFATPTKVKGKEWKQVSAGNRHACAVKKDGKLFCWGRDDEGQLGDGVVGPDVPTPTKVNGGSWAEAGAGLDHTCARKSNGRIICWGRDNFGQLGDGTIGPNNPTPTPVDGGATNWTRFAGGNDHTCAVKVDSRILCWGRDNDGQLGDGFIGGDSATPHEVIDATRNWSQVAAGGFHTCAVRSGGQLLCWGNDTAGQFGDLTIGPNSPTPVLVVANV